MENENPESNKVLNSWDTKFSIVCPNIIAVVCVISNVKDDFCYLHRFYRLESYYCHACLTHSYCWWCHIDANNIRHSAIIGQISRADLCRRSEEGQRLLSLTLRGRSEARAVGMANFNAQNFPDEVRKLFATKKCINRIREKKVRKLQIWCPLQNEMCCFCKISIILWWHNHFTIILDPQSWLVLGPFSRFIITLNLSTPSWNFPDHP